MADVEERDRAALRAWVKEGIAAKGVSPTKAAKEAGISVSALTKFLNNTDYKYTLNTRNIAKLERYFGRAAPRTATAAHTRPDLEALLLDQEMVSISQSLALEALIGRRLNVEKWRIEGTPLQAVGVMPGDIVLVDLDEPPLAGDIVCAEIHERGNVRTVFRLYQKPYLVPATFDAAIQMPIVVDDRNVIVRGVVTDRIAKRRSIAE